MMCLYIIVPCQIMSAVFDGITVHSIITHNSSKKAMSVALHRSEQSMKTLKARRERDKALRASFTKQGKLV